MRRGQLNDGTTFLGIKVEHFVSKEVFANALADNCWTYNQEFNSHLSKTEAMKILKRQLFHKGLEGIEKHSWEGASEEFAQPHVDAYEKSCEWIDKNYPYLNQSF